MGFVTGLMASFGQSQPVGDPDHWTLRYLGSKTHAGPMVSEATAVNLPVVWACVTLIADAIASLPVDVFRRTPTGREPLSDHPLAALLNDSANEEMSAGTQLNTQMLHALLWGNGYAEIERRRNGAPVALWPLLPDRTMPRVTVEAEERRFRYRTLVNGREAELRPADVLHVKGYSHDGLTGLSPITVARQSIGLGLAMEEFGGKFFANEARSGGFLQHPGKLGDKAQTNIEESFNEKAGLERAHKIRVLEEGMKFVPVTIPPDDAQFIESRQFQIAEIGRIFRVPLVLLQNQESTPGWASSVESINIIFATHTLRPWVDRIENEIDRKLLTPREREQGLFVKLNMGALMRGDMAARGELHQRGILTGWLTRNEARALEDLNPLPGLDEPLVPVNMQGGNSQGAIDDA